MKTLLNESIVLWALFPGSDEDDFVPESDLNGSGAGDELNPDDEEYIDVDEGEDEAINSDDDAYETEENAEDIVSTGEEEDLDEG